MVDQPGQLIVRRQPKVYLAGAITGLTYDQGQDWREYATVELAKKGIQAFSPLRAKQYLRKDGVIEDGQYDQVSPLSSDKGIVTRDRWDIMSNCDMVLFNMLGLKRVSIGTCIEFGWADAFRKPGILVMEKEGNVHEHAMVRMVTGYRVESLDEAIRLLNCILNP